MRRGCWPRTWHNLARRSLLVGLVTLLTVVALAACGTQSAPKIGHDCGEVTGGFRKTSISDPDEAESCLWHAYIQQPCAAATLTYIAPGTDFSDTHTITIQPKKSGCVVEDTEQTYLASGNHTSPLTTSTCASLQQRNVGGLIVVGCGAEGDITILARPAEQVGHVCGTILYIAIVMSCKYMLQAATAPLRRVFGRHTPALPAHQQRCSTG